MTNENTEVKEIQLTEHMVGGCADTPVFVKNVNEYFIPTYDLRILFQNGLPSEVGRNGIRDEEAIVCILNRLRTWNGGKFACEENSNAITHLEETLRWMQRRTSRRIAEGVEGTYKV